MPAPSVPCQSPRSSLLVSAPARHSSMSLPRLSGVAAGDALPLPDQLLRALVGDEGVVLCVYIRAVEAPVSCAVGICAGSSGFRMPARGATRRVVCDLLAQCTCSSPTPSPGPSVAWVSVSVGACYAYARFVRLCHHHRLRVGVVWGRLSRPPPALSHAARVYGFPAQAGLRPWCVLGAPVGIPAPPVPCLSPRSSLLVSAPARHSSMSLPRSSGGVAGEKAGGVTGEGRPRWEGCRRSEPSARRPRRGREPRRYVPSCRLCAAFPRLASRPTMPSQAPSSTRPSRSTPGLVASGPSAPLPSA